MPRDRRNRLPVASPVVVILSQGIGYGSGWGTFSYTAFIAVRTPGPEQEWRKIMLGSTFGNTEPGFLTYFHLFSTICGHYFLR